MTQILRTDVDQRAVSELAARFRGELVLPADAAYEDRRRVWNGSINRFPALIARCAGVADVIEAVRFGRRTGLAVAVRLVKQHYDPDNFFLLNQNIPPAWPCTHGQAGAHVRPPPAPQTPTSALSALAAFAYHPRPAGRVRLPARRTAPGSAFRRRRRRRTPPNAGR